MSRTCPILAPFWISRLCEYPHAVSIHTPGKGKRRAEKVQREIWANEVVPIIWTCYVLKYRLTDFEIYWEVILAKAWHICYNGLVKPIRVSQINRLTFRTVWMKYNWISDYWQSYGVMLFGCFFVCELSHSNLMNLFYARDWHLGWRGAAGALHWKGDATWIFQKKK